MARAFTKRFVTNKLRSTTMLDMYPIRQENGESLKDYYHRFWSKYALIDRADERSAIDTFRTNLRHGFNVFSQLMRTDP